MKDLFRKSLEKMRIGIILFILVLMTSNYLAGQSLYDLRWQHNGIDYAGFMVFFNENDIYMRIGYTVANGYNLIHSEYYYTADRETNDFVLMEGNEPYYIQQQTDNLYQDFHFMWVKDEEGWIGPIAATSLQLVNEDFDGMTMVKYTELNPANLTPDYLQWFYTPDDPDYYTLLNANTPEAYNIPAEMVNQPLSMHLVVAANTAIADIGASTKVDMQNLTSEFEGIAAALQMTCYKNIIAQEDFTKEKLLQTVHGIQPGPNDIVVFLYSGHGFRFSDQQERFPMLDMRKSLYIQPSEHTYVSLQDVYDIITQKGARLNIILGDCCNENIGVPKISGSSFIAGRSTLNANTQKLAQLFLNASGNILGAGAVEGQFAIGNNAIGGYFTSSFISSIREEVSKLKSNENPNWENILDNTIKATLKKSEICQQCKPQNAFFVETVE